MTHDIMISLYYASQDKLGRVHPTVNGFPSSQLALHRPVAQVDVSKWCRTVASIEI